MILRALKNHYTKFVERARSGLPRVSIAPPAARLEAAYRDGLARAVEASASWPRELRDAVLTSLPRATDYRTVEEVTAAIAARVKHASAVHAVLATAERGLDPVRRAALRRNAALAVRQCISAAAFRGLALDQLAEQDEETAITTAIEEIVGPPPRREQPPDAAAIYAARQAAAR